MDDYEENIELSSYERTILFHLGSINTLHHFQGAFYHSSSLQQKLRRLFASNPYLAGRLQRKFFWRDVFLSTTSARNLEINNHYGERHFELNPFENTSCDDIRSQFASCFVSSGYNSVGNSVLFKMTVFVYQKPLGFSILTSLSHVLGDAHLHYLLLSMLSDANITAKPVPCSIHIKTKDGAKTMQQSQYHSQSRDYSSHLTVDSKLNPQRLPLFLSAVRAVVGTAMLQCMQSYSLLTGFILNLIFRPKSSTKMFRLNSEYIDKIKAENSLFVSTNDVLMNVLACEIFRSDFGCLTLDLRPRLTDYYGIELDTMQQRASNVIFPVLLIREKLSSAISVRRAIENWSNANEGRHFNGCPSIWQQMCMNGVFFASNWATVQRQHRPFRLNGAVCRQHLSLNLGGARNGVHAAIVFDLDNEQGESSTQLAIAVTSTEEILRNITRHPLFSPMNCYA